MYHSITFATTLDDLDTGSLVGQNTWTDWHLIPAPRPTMSMPKPALNFVEVPGRNGTIDMTTYLTGDVTFSDRTGSFEFIVDNGHEHWMTIYKKIASYLHGKRLYMCLTDDDPGYYYEGRFTLNAWKSDPSNSKVVIDYQVSPFKYSILVRGYDLTIWDTFNFETDMDWGVLSELTVDGNSEVIIPADDYPFKVSIIAISLGENTSLTATFRGVSISLTQVGQVFNFPKPTVRGDNILTLSGDGVAKITFRDGSL